MLHWGVYFIVISVVFRELGTVKIAFITLNQAVIIFLFFATLIQKKIQKQVVYKFDLLDVSLITFGFYFWVSNFMINPEYTWGIRACINFIRSLICYFLVVVLINNKIRIKYLILSYIIASTAMVLTGDLYSILTKGLSFEEGRRIGLSGLSGHYIKYAFYALMSVPLTYFIMKNAKGKSKLAHFVVLTVLCLGGLFSGSRGAIIAFGFIIVGIAFLEIMNSRDAFEVIKKTVIPVFIGLSLFAIFWFKGGSELFGSLFTGFLSGELDQSLSTRKAMNLKTINAFFENPFFGMGLDSIRNTYGLASHGQWLQIFAELGVFGVFLALFIILNLIYSYFVAAKNARTIDDKALLNYSNGVILSILTFLFWGTYENIGLITADKILFMLFGMIRCIRDVCSDLVMDQKERV